MREKYGDLWGSKSSKLPEEEGKKTERGKENEGKGERSGRLSVRTKEIRES